MPGMELRGEAARRKFEEIEQAKYKQAVRDAKKAGTRTYSIGNTVVPEEDRDRYQALAHKGTYRNVRTEQPDAGDWGSYTIELTDAEVRALQAKPPENLRYLEEVQRVIPCVTADVPALDELQAMHAGDLYGQGFTGRGIVVGVVDTGIGSTALASLFDIKAIRSELGDSPYQENHGANVASLAVPRAAQLVLSRSHNDAATLGSDATTAAAINWMVDTIGVDVINMSYVNSGGSSSVENDAIANGIAQGVKFFAAAGNNGTNTPNYPANTTGVIAVGSLDRFQGNKRASFSSYGSWVDLWVNGINIRTYDQSVSFEYDGGTSLSSPLAAYVFASKLTKGKNTIGPASTLNAMLDGAKPAPGSDLGGGKVLDADAGVRKMPDYCGEV